MSFVKLPEEERLLGTTRIQILKYLGTESSPWSGLLGLHLIATTVARPFSQEVVTVEDLMSNKRRNVIAFYYSKYMLLFHRSLSTHATAVLKKYFSPQRFCLCQLEEKKGATEAG